MERGTWPSLGSVHESVTRAATVAPPQPRLSLLEDLRVLLGQAYRSQRLLAAAIDALGRTPVASISGDPVSPASVDGAMALLSQLVTSIEQAAESLAQEIGGVPS